MSKEPGGEFKAHTQFTGSLENYVPIWALNDRAKLIPLANSVESQFLYPSHKTVEQDAL